MHPICAIIAYMTETIKITRFSLFVQLLLVRCGSSYSTDGHLKSPVCSTEIKMNKKLILKMYSPLHTLW